MKIRRLSLLLVVLIVLVTNCYRETTNTVLQQKSKSQSNVIQLLQQIDSLENLGEYNATVAKEYINKIEEFSNEYPEDPMTPEFLYKAGLLAMTVAKLSDNKDDAEIYCKKALHIFDDIQRVYPDYANIRNCLLNKGVIYDDILHDYENAEILYREFIVKYPTDSLAVNIESYLQYLGKTPEEILGDK